MGSPDPITIDYAKLGKAVSWEMDFNKISARKLARWWGVAPTTICRLRKGEGPMSAEMFMAAVSFVRRNAGEFSKFEYPTKEQSE